MKSTFLHLLSIASPEYLEMHSNLWGDIWQETPVVRNHYMSALDQVPAEKLQWADFVLVDCSNKSEAYAVLAQVPVPRDRLLLLSFTELSRGRIATDQGSLDVIPAFEVRAKWREFFGAHIPEERTGDIKWASERRDDHTLKGVRADLGSSLNSAVRTYFPNSSAALHVESVSGGLSGTPLLRVSIGTDGYFLKFFRKEEEFIREWDKHQRAKIWLGSHTVDLLPVPELSHSGVNQAAVFKRRGVNSSDTHRYPICFHSADVTATLKNLYPSTNDAFSLMAYTQVIEVLSGNQPQKLLLNLPLMELPDTAPGNESTGKLLTIMDSLRSEEFLEAIGNAITELMRYSKVNCPSFADDLPKLQKLVYDSNPSSLLRPASLSFGRSHGDANSRNFLFDGTKLLPTGLKIIDCGSYEESAPLIFDLAQMESDLKIALMATEESDNFGDIDTANLAIWWEQESASLKDPFEFEIAVSDKPTIRAYITIQAIRAKAREHSGQSGEWRGYLFCLLYWTLRKLRRRDISHAKRILALRSATRIAAKLHDWRAK